MRILYHTTLPLRSLSHEDIGDGCSFYNITQIDLYARYPPGYELPNRIPEQQLPTYLVAKVFGEDGFLRLNVKLLSRKQTKYVHLSV